MIVRKACKTELLTAQNAAVQRRLVAHDRPDPTSALARSSAAAGTWWCPVPTKIARSRSLTCDEESSVSGQSALPDGSQAAKSQAAGLRNLNWQRGKFADTGQVVIEADARSLTCPAGWPGCSPAASTPPCGFRDGGRTPCGALRMVTAPHSPGSDFGRAGGSGGWDRCRVGGCRRVWPPVSLVLVPAVVLALVASLNGPWRRTACGRPRSGRCWRRPIP